MFCKPPCSNQWDFKLHHQNFNVNFQREFSEKESHERCKQSIQKHLILGYTSITRPQEMI